MRFASALLFVVACTPTKSAPTTPTPPSGTGSTATPPATTPAVAVKAEKVRTVEGITEYKLPNGLQVLLFPDQTQSQITLNIVYHVGSRLEGYGETGMAHLLEHMMYKGSPRFRNVLKLLEAKGGLANGSTWTDRTNYFESLPASPESLDWMLDLESDRMIHASVSKEDLESEFSVVRNEFERDENDSQRILGERVESTAYLWHNYGKSTIGSRSDIERVPIPRLRAFYEKYYQPDNTTLVITGKFEEAAALAQVEKRFGPIPKPTRVLVDSYSVEPVQDGERSVTLRRNGDVADVMVAYHSVGAASPDFPVVKAALSLLAHKPSGRLYKKLVETKLASSVEGDQQYFRDPGLAEVTAEVRDSKNADKVLQTIIAETESLASSKIDDKDLERWKNQELKQIELAMSNSQYVGLLMTEAVGAGDWRLIFAYRDRVKTVTSADVQRIAKAFFKQSNRTVGQFLPTKEIDRAPLAETPNIADAVKNVKEGTQVNAGEAFTASLDNIEKRTAITTLKGGLKAAFLTKKTRGGKVSASLDLHWGDETSLKNKAMVGEALAVMIQRGTTTKTYEQLHDLEDKLKASISITGGAQGLNIRVETVKENLPAVLDLVAEMLTKPAFPDKELEVVRQQVLTELEQERQNPETLAEQEAFAIMSPWAKDDPRRFSSVPEKIATAKNLSITDLKSYYRDFAGASHGEVVVIGDFDQDATAAQIEKLLGGFQSKKPYTRLADKAFAVAATTKSVDIKDKEMTMLYVAHDIAMKDSDPDYPAWLMLNQVLGGGAGSRIWLRLREKEGITYGAGTYTNVEAQDAAGFIAGYVLVAPQNVAKAKASILEEFNKVATGKIDDAELSRARDAWLKQRETLLSDDNYVASLLTRNLFEGRDMAWRKSLREKVSKVTTGDVERTAKKWLKPDRLIVVDVGDKAKAEAGAKGPQPETPKQDPAKK